MFIILSPSMSRTHYSLPFSPCPELRIPFSLTPREPKRNMFLIGLSSLWFFLCLKNTPIGSSFVMYHYSLHLCLFKRLFSPCPLKTLSRHLCNGPLFSPYLSFKNAILSMSFRNAVKIPDPVIIGSKTLQYCWSLTLFVSLTTKNSFFSTKKGKNPTHHLDWFLACTLSVTPTHISSRFLFQVGWWWSRMWHLKNRATRHGSWMSHFSSSV